MIWFWVLQCIWPLSMRKVVLVPHSKAFVVGTSVLLQAVSPIGWSLTCCEHQLCNVTNEMGDFIVVLWFIAICSSHAFRWPTGCCMLWLSSPCCSKILATNVEPGKKTSLWDSQQKRASKMFDRCASVRQPQSVTRFFECSLVPVEVAISTAHTHHTALSCAEEGDVSCEETHDDDQPPSNLCIQASCIQAIDDGCSCEAKCSRGRSRCWNFHKIPKEGLDCK